jgi:hypothetical protein
MPVVAQVRQQLKHEAIVRRLRQAGASNPALRPGGHANVDAKMQKKIIDGAVVQK